MKHRSTCSPFSVPTPPPPSCPKFLLSPFSRRLTLVKPIQGHSTQKNKFFMKNQSPPSAETSTAKAESRRHSRLETLETCATSAFTNVYTVQTGTPIFRRQRSAGILSFRFLLSTFCFYFLPSIACPMNSLSRDLNRSAMPQAYRHRVP